MTALDASHVPWEPFEIRGGSNQYSFIEADIPVGGLVTGVGDVCLGNTAVVSIFGGQAGVPKTSTTTRTATPSPRRARGPSPSPCGP